MSNLWKLGLGGVTDLSSLKSIIGIETESDFSTLQILGPPQTSQWF